MAGQKRKEYSQCLAGHFVLLLIVMVLFGISLVSCQQRDNSQSSASAELSTKDPNKNNLTIYFVGIAAPMDLFHGVVARGALRAGEDLGVRVVYIYPDKLTLDQYIRKIEQAVATRPDGMVLMGIDEKGIEPFARKAKEQGVVLALNPAPPVTERPLRNADDLYISRVGSDEYSAGRLVAEGLIRAGVQGNVFCGVHAPGDGTLMSRSQGLEDRLAEEGISTDIGEVPFEPGRCEEVLFNYLRVHPKVGAVVTLDSRINASARAARRRIGREDLLLVGFDLDLPTLEGIKNGEMLFTIDQQQFWRGYIPVLEIVHHIRYGLTQANYFLSGPNIVDASSVDQVLELVKDGYR